MTTTPIHSRKRRRPATGSFARPVLLLALLVLPPGASCTPVAPKPVAGSGADGLELSAVRLLNVTASTDNWRDRDPSIASDGQGTWMAAWETLGDPSSGAAGRHQRIALARSVDDGLTWTRPFTVPAMDGGSGTPGGAESSPVVAADGRGNWVVAWQAIGRLGGPDADILFVHSGDGGATWSAPRPALAAFTRDAGQELRPSLLPLDDGSWLLGWESGGPPPGGFRVVVARSEDGGRSWTRPLTLGAGSGSARALALATDRGGVVVAAWEAFASPAAGGPPSQPAVDGPPSQPAVDGPPSQPGKDAPPAGPVAAVRPSWDILLSRSADHGRTWTAAFPLRAAQDPGFDATDEGVALAASGEAGTWLALWSSSVPPAGSDPADLACGAAVAEGGEPVALSPRWVLASGSADGGLTWSPPRLLAAGTPTRFGSPQAGASVASLPAGGFLAAWEARDCDGSDADVVVCRIEGHDAVCEPRHVAPYGPRDEGSRDRAARVVAVEEGGVVAWSGDYDGHGAAVADEDLRIVTVRVPR